MSYLNGKLNTTKETLNLFHSDTNATDTNLDSLTDEVNQIDLRIQELTQQVYNTKNANIEGEKPECGSETGFFKPLSQRETGCHQHIGSPSSCFITFLYPMINCIYQNIVFKIKFHNIIYHISCY